MRKVLRANTAVDCWEHEALFHEPDRVHLDDERSTVRLPRRDVHIVRESEVVFEDRVGVHLTTRTELALLSSHWQRRA